MIKCNSQLNEEKEDKLIHKTLGFTVDIRMKILLLYILILYWTILIRF